MWIKTALKELAAGCYCCLKCNDASDLGCVHIPPASLLTKNTAE